LQAHALAQQEEHLFQAASKDINTVGAPEKLLQESSLPAESASQKCWYENRHARSSKSIPLHRGATCSLGPGNCHFHQSLGMCSPSNLQCNPNITCAPRCNHHIRHGSVAATIDRCVHSAESSASNRLAASEGSATQSSHSLTRSPEMQCPSEKHGSNFSQTSQPHVHPHRNLASLHLEVPSPLSTHCGTTPNSKHRFKPNASISRPTDVQKGLLSSQDGQTLALKDASEGGRSERSSSQAGLVSGGSADLQKFDLVSLTSEDPPCAKAMDSLENQADGVPLGSGKRIKKNGCKMMSPTQLKLGIANQRLSGVWSQLCAEGGTDVVEGSSTEAWSDTDVHQRHNDKVASTAFAVSSAKPIHSTGALSKRHTASAPEAWRDTAKFAAWQGACHKNASGKLAAKQSVGTMRAITRGSEFKVGRGVSCKGSPDSSSFENHGATKRHASTEPVQGGCIAASHASGPSHAPRSGGLDPCSHAKGYTPETRPRLVLRVFEDGSVVAGAPLKTDVDAEVEICCVHRHQNPSPSRTGAARHRPDMASLISKRGRESDGIRCQLEELHAADVTSSSVAYQLTHPHIGHSGNAAAQPAACNRKEIMHDGGKFDGNCSQGRSADGSCSPAPHISVPHAACAREGQANGAHRDPTGHVTSPNDTSGQKRWSDQNSHSSKFPEASHRDASFQGHLGGPQGQPAGTSHTIFPTAGDSTSKEQHNDMLLAMLSRERKHTQAVAGRCADLEAEIQEMQATYEVSLSCCCDPCLLWNEVHPNALHFHISSSKC
jgi:hypothetical protein